MIPVILERLAELIKSKMAVSEALSQVAQEIRTLEEYCNENRITIPGKRLTTLHLKEGKYKG